MDNRSIDMMSLFAERLFTQYDYRKYDTLRGMNKELVAVWVNVHHFIMRCM